MRPDSKRPKIKRSKASKSSKSSKTIKSTRKSLKSNDSALKIDSKKQRNVRKIIVDNIEYNYPPALLRLKRGNKIVSDRVKIVVYTLYLRLKKKVKLRKLVEDIYLVRDQLAYSGGDFNSDGSNSYYKLIEDSLLIEAEMQPRNQSQDKVISYHGRNKNLKKYRLRLYGFERKVESFSYGEIMEKMEAQLNMFWDARDLYLDEVDSGSIMFTIWVFYEGLTNFCFVDFNNFSVIGGDSELFGLILDRIKNEY